MLKRQNNPQIKKLIDVALRVIAGHDEIRRQTDPLQHKSELWDNPTMSPPCQFIKWLEVRWGKKVSCVCVCVSVLCIKEYSERLLIPRLSELPLMWWMRLSAPKFMAGNISVWEVCVWRGSGRLSATVQHLWQVTFFPLSPLLHHLVQTVTWFQSCYEASSNRRREIWT